MIPPRPVIPPRRKGKQKKVEQREVGKKHPFFISGVFLMALSAVLLTGYAIGLIMCIVVMAIGPIEIGKELFEKVYSFNFVVVGFVGIAAGLILTIIGFILKLIRGR